MADPEHSKIIGLGVEAWNKWRDENAFIKPDLSKVDLSKTNLSGVNLNEANLNKANLRWANLTEANLIKSRLWGANLSGAMLHGADLTEADLHTARIKLANLHGAKLGKADLSGADLFDSNFSGADLNRAKLEGAKLGKADLSGANLKMAILSEALLNSTNFYKADMREAHLDRANLSDADFREANLSGADLSGSNLRRANLNGANLTETNLIRVSFVETKLEGADLSHSKVYGISAWNLKTNQKTKQLSLVITDLLEPTITVDDIEVAQFIYFILKNKKIRNVINTVANKAVLILGRFTKKRKEVLDAIADKLRTMDLVPIIFDFEPSEKQDIIETVITLASLSKFIIADVTAARVIADELRSFVPDFAVPVVPVFQPSKKEPKPYASLNTLCRKYTWVFEPVLYESTKHLIEILPDKVIKPAEIKRLELHDIK